MGAFQTAQEPPLRVSQTSDAEEKRAARVADHVVSGTHDLRRPPASPRPDLPNLPGPPPVGAWAVAGLGPSSTLNTDVRAALEPRLGHDLSSVQLHTGGAAHALMGRVHARAFALGEHIAISPGDAQPTSQRSWRLLAHELAHVVTPRPEPMIQRDGEDDVCETSADDALTCEPGQDNPQVGPQVGPQLGPQLGPLGGSSTSVADPDPAPSPSPVPAPDDTGTSGDTAADETLIAAHARQLRQVYADKATYVASINTSGPQIGETLADYDAEISQRVASIRTLGVRLPATQVVQRVLAGESLTELRPRVRYEPAQGPFRQGAGLRFVVELAYVPRTDPVRVDWTGQLIGNRTFAMVDREARDTELVLDSTFWFRGVPITLPDGSKLTVTANLSVGPRRIAAPELSVTLPIEPYRYETDELLRMSMRGGMMTGPTTARALAGSTLSFSLSSGPPGEQYLMNWSWLNLDRNDPLPGTPFARHHEASSVVELTLTDPGRYTVIARIAPAVSSPWVIVPVDPGHAIQTAALQVQVGTLAEWGSMAIDQLSSEQTPRPTLTDFGARLDTDARENDLLASRATSEDKEHYEKAAEQRREMASTLQDRIGVPAAQVQPFPAADADFGAGVYATAVPASLVIANSAATPGGGIQPLTLFLTMRRTDTGFAAVLIDATTKDMSPYPGTGAGSREAADAALQRWRLRNPYPIGGLVVYRYVLPDRTILRGRFSTTTREKEIEKFIEDILTIGGYVVAVLLLLAPEATVTKALALGMLGLSIGYGIHRISRNVELGVGAFDSRNVLEAVGILGSAVGIGGSALRSAGLRAARPLMYRAGNWMVISTVAADVGTLTYVGVESYELLRASLADPNLSDSARIALLARTAGQLLAQSMMVVAGNKDLLRGGLRRSDFFATRAPGLGDLPTLAPTAGRSLVELDPGSRIDLQAELVRRGAPPAEVLQLSDTALIAQLHGVQQGAMRGPEVYPRAPVDMTPAQQTGVVRAGGGHTAPGVTVERTGSPTHLLMSVGTAQVEVAVQFVAPPAATGVHGARSGPGRVRLDYNRRTKRWVASVDVDPRLYEREAGFLLREELDEAAEIVRRLNDRVTAPRQPLQGAGLRRAVEGEQRASLARPAVIGDIETAHDVSSFRTLGRLFAEARRSASVDDFAQLDRMLIEMGFNPKSPDIRVRAALIRAVGEPDGSTLASYVWDGPFTRPLIEVPSAATHHPQVVGQVRAYTEALAGYRVDRGGPAAAQLTAIEQLAAAAHRAPTLEVNALVREGMARPAAEALVAATGGGNPYTHLYDVLLTSFELRRNLTTAPDLAGRRFTVVENGNPRPPLAIQALNNGGPPEGIPFADFIQRMNETGVVPTVQRMASADGAGWVQWEFVEPGGASSRVRLDIPGLEAATGEGRGYLFHSGRNLHAGTTFSPAGQSLALPMSAGGVELPVNAAGAHIRIVPDSTMAPTLTGLGVGPVGAQLRHVLANRPL